MEIKLLDLDDDAELGGYADVRIAAQAVDRPGEPVPSQGQIIGSLREGQSGLQRLRPSRRTA
ncbi:hypothetical protein [Lentzea nigeriaca]|uniref:hypothetical protein n=1 Tax=Lentzea nigeriaca TaxID=1128665 RepID=UPI00195B50B5|nr:hypothetical protein [Lentzea nigeriaca]MBM7860215.1 hypothetical protein [Lentzea nigeriaca]